MKHYRPRQLTSGRYGHILANTGVWSKDGRWIVYDVRSDPAGAVFDGTRIEKVSTDTGAVEVLYESRNGAACGIPTYCPTRDEIVFVLGPEHPDSSWSYAADKRQGVVLSEASGQCKNLEARNLGPTFQPGALRGGTHLHTWDARGEWLAFTYEDAVLPKPESAVAGTRDIAREPQREFSLRNLGVCIPDVRVRVDQTHPRNHDGAYFSVLVTETTANPQPGSDEITRACEEAWIGDRDYALLSTQQLRPRMLAFQGHVKTHAGTIIPEAFVVELPQDPTKSGVRPLAGTAQTAPAPPAGCLQRRITFTESRRFPGIQGPRHWLRSAPRGDEIALLMKDDDGIVQLWCVSPKGGTPRQVTRNPFSIASAFTWSPDGARLAHIADGSVCVTDARSGQTTRLTERARDGDWPRPEACVFSPDGERIAYVQQVGESAARFNQIFVVPA